jgi:hypothetical protein
MITGTHSFFIRLLNKFVINVLGMRKAVLHLKKCDPVLAPSLSG